MEECGERSGSRSGAQWLWSERLSRGHAHIGRPRGSTESVLCRRARFRLRRFRAESYGRSGLGARILSEHRSHRLCRHEPEVQRQLRLRRRLRCRDRGSPVARRGRAIRQELSLQRCAHLSPAGELPLRFRAAPARGRRQRNQEPGDLRTLRLHARPGLLYRQSELETGAFRRLGGRARTDAVRGLGKSDRHLFQQHAQGRDLHQLHTADICRLAAERDDEFDAGRGPGERLGQARRSMASRPRLHLFACASERGTGSPPRAQHRKPQSRLEGAPRPIRSEFDGPLQWRADRQQFHAFRPAESKAPVLHPDQSRCRLPDQRYVPALWPGGQPARSQNGRGLHLPRARPRLLRRYPRGVLMMKRAFIALAAALAISGAAIPPGLAAAAPAANPARVMSLNLCTDQLLLVLLPRERITSVSFLSLSSQNAVFTAEAAGVPVNYGSLEEVFVQMPDLVIAGTATTPTARGLLSRARIPLLQVPPAENFDQIRSVTRLVSRAVGEELKGEALIQHMDRTLAELAATTPARRIVVAGRGKAGGIPGRGTLFLLVHTAGGGGEVGGGKGHPGGF